MRDQRKRNRWGNFSWISPAPLLASANDLLAKGMDDLINSIRPRWVAAQRAAGVADRDMRLTLEGQDGDFSFLILGDPGEQDASQYAVVRPLLSKGRDTDFMIIDSDVIYPAGDVNDYLDGFYLPYRDYPAAIYAVPGNHDWYDGLNGFMWNFCDAEPLPPVKYRAGGFSWKERLARSLWRKPSPPKLPQLLHAREQLPERRRNATQPGPYFAIYSKSRNLVIVCIDTGITGTLDREQGDWLRRVSRLPGTKVLITGKPIYVDGKYHPGKIDWGPDGDQEVERWVKEDFETVDDIVRDPRHGYRAVIGGDIHNYQRYSVWVNQSGQRRLIHYLVSGGGGAYLSSTQLIPRVDLQPKNERGAIPVDRITEEENFWCYPLRGDALARFVRRFSFGFALIFLAAIAIVAVAVWQLGLEGFGGKDVKKFLPPPPDEGGGELWEALAVVPLTIVGAAMALTGVLVSNALVRPGYRTMTGATLTIAFGALLLWAANELFIDWDNLIWKMALATLMAIAAPLLGVAGYYLVRDFIAPSVRVAIALAVPLGLALAVVLEQIEQPEEASVVVGVSLLLLWIGIAIVGRLRTPADPEGQKALLRLGRLLPLTLALAGIAGALVIVGIREWSWIPIALAIAFAGVVVLAAGLLILVCCRGFLALPWLLAGGRVNPDGTARWLAKQLGSNTHPVRESARRETISLKTRTLAGLVYKTPLLRDAISVLAEATTVPFFKSFLRADVKGQELVITTYGVSGLERDEENPSVEDKIAIPLRPRPDVDSDASPDPSEEES